MACIYEIISPQMFGWSVVNMPFCVCVRILRKPWQMTWDKVREVFREAVQVWSHVTPLTFTEVHSGHADIIIDFAR